MLPWRLLKEKISKKKWDPLRAVLWVWDVVGALLEPDFNVMIGAKWAARERQLTSRRRRARRWGQINRNQEAPLLYSALYSCVGLMAERWAWHPAVSFGLIIWLIITCSASLSTTSRETWSRSQSGEIFCCASCSTVVTQKEKILLIWPVWEHWKLKFKSHLQALNRPNLFKLHNVFCY